MLKFVVILFVIKGVAVTEMENPLRKPHREKFSNMEFLYSVFSHIRNKYRMLRKKETKSPRTV